ncbi:hypothetical protein GCM10022420_081060 [Streptomyces iranensis]
MDGAVGEAVDLHHEIGNFNVPAIHALGGALDLSQSIGLPAISDHLLSLGDRLIERLDRLGIDLADPASGNGAATSMSWLAPMPCGRLVRPRPACGSRPSGAAAGLFRPLQQR